MTGNPRPRLRPGDELTLGEQDYKFGVGRLSIVVEQILERVTLDGELWVRVRGLCRRAPTDAGAVREIYVRVSALPLRR
ncbi:hypothetical protein J2S43_004937 [Catenuloplanes nepalensis]|uniref:DUF3850 domain-containing protein n=1 Tax=Catenuloplanes nepalensis TaxID=587533 RepID=A0ABT9MYI8_9ACTN|nr:hypothetical protein [Catenuloplanes nepalensis]MDP9796425.1 hypothetical protein [Catenuloplanes nepalensis]